MINALVVVEDYYNKEATLTLEDVHTFSIEIKTFATMKEAEKFKAEFERVRKFEHSALRRSVYINPSLLTITAHNSSRVYTSYDAEFITNLKDIYENVNNKTAEIDTENNVAVKSIIEDAYAAKENDANKHYVDIPAENLDLANKAVRVINEDTEFTAGIVFNDSDIYTIHIEW